MAEQLQRESEDILEMDGRKAVPLRALIVEERVKSFKTRWYRVKRLLRPCMFNIQGLFDEKENGAHILWNDRRRKTMSYQTKGTNDILPGTSEKWQFVEETARLILKIINARNQNRFLNIMK